MQEKSIRCEDRIDEAFLPFAVSLNQTNGTTSFEIQRDELGTESSNDSSCQKTGQHYRED